MLKAHKETLNMDNKMPTEDTITNDMRQLFPVSDQILDMKFIALENLKELEFYFKHLEDFIDKEEDIEIEELNKHTINMSQERKAIFWEWNYPFHWENIFRNQLRSSFIVTLISITEFHINTVAGLVNFNIMQNSGLNDDITELKSRRYYIKLFKCLRFRKPDDKSWQKLYEIWDIRNCIIHANSLILRYKQKKIQNLLKTLPGLKGVNSIELSKEFNQYSLNIIKTFLNDFYDEALQICKASNGESNGVRAKV